MKFPCHLYKVPGPHMGHGGVMYKYVGCRDEEEFKTLSAAGWRASLEEAAAPTAEEVIQSITAAEEVIEDMSPATREELEQKARELGIGFNKRTSDETLAERIAEAL
jgi:hypothetical protein